MLRPAVALTEYEDNILFDLDDPDFSAGERSSSPTPHTLGAGLRRASRGSCGSSASLVTLEVPNNRERHLSGCSSCASFDGDLAYLSIESIRSHLHSCFTCGVSWVEDHVSLDCPECGGYSLERPCPACDGQCDATWKRDLASSHASGKAHWEGCCNNRSPPPSPSTTRLLLRKLVRLNMNKRETSSDADSALGISRS